VTAFPLLSSNVAARFCLGAALLLLPVVASAQPMNSSADCATVDATEEEAVRLRDQGQDRAAYELLRPLTVCATTPRFFARAGLAAAAASVWVDAERWLERALDDRGHPWIAARLAMLTEQLRQVRTHLGNLDVVVNAPAGELRVGGARVAALPLSRPLRVPAGMFTYEVVAEGFLPEVRRVDVTPGDAALTRENVTLTPRTPLVAPLPRGEAPVVTTRVEVVPVAPVAQPSRVMFRIAVTASAVGGAALAAGVLSAALGEAAAATWNDPSTCLRPGAGTRETQCGSYGARAEEARVAAIVSFSVAGLAAAAAVTLFLRSPTAPSRVAAACAPDPGGLGVVCAGRF
jgi:hypothetical protein